MEEFPPLGSPSCKETTKKKAAVRPKEKLLQNSTSASGSFKELARLIEDSKTTGNSNSKCPKERSHNDDSTPIVETAAHLEKGGKHDIRKGTKNKTKTKFVPFDLGNDCEEARRPSKHKDKGSSGSQHLFHRNVISRNCKQGTHDLGNRRYNHHLGSHDSQCPERPLEDDSMLGGTDEVFMFDGHHRSSEVSSEVLPALMTVKKDPQEQEVIYQRQYPEEPPRLCNVSMGKSDNYTSSYGIPLDREKVQKEVKGVPKKGKKHKPFRIPAPLELLGFKTKRGLHSAKQNSNQEESVALKLADVKPKRRKRKEKRALVAPTIQSDESNSGDEGDDTTYEWVYCEPADKNFDLVSLNECASSAVVGLTLARSSDALIKMLKAKKLSLEENLLLVSLISKACACKVVPKSSLQILSRLQNANFYREFLHWLISEMNGNIHALDRLTLTSFFKDVTNILYSQKVTSVGTDPTVFPRLFLMSTTEKWKDVLGEDHARIILELQTQKEAKAEESVAAVLASDDNFRRVPIMPTNDDINPHIKPSLKQNKVKGSYSDVNEYLDLQFRLLREDFIQPLREGISEYQDLMNKKDRRALRLYQNVKIRRIICAEKGIVYRLQFDASSLSHVDWRNTKRLLYGSMVCISNDKFLTVRFATVSDRKPENLQQGRVDVKFDSKVRLDSKTVFTMVETPALFEAYRHILLGLQHIECSSLAFKRYFVECQDRVFTPQYLDRQYSSFYEFTSLKRTKNPDSAHESKCSDATFDGSSTENETDDGCSDFIDILSEKYWPSPEDLCMDESQFRAFHTALTKELAIIQGPPGTGKTYVGLKIMKALLNNAQAWNPDNTKPLLVVCYTNHALDQFLEGILSFFKGEILRVGGRSKNERLFSHNLNRRRYDLFRKRHRLSEDISNILDIRQQLRDDFITHQNEIEQYGQQIDATANGILHENQLKPFMKNHYRQIKKPAEEAHSALLEWLDIKGIGKSKQKAEHKEKEQVEGNIDLSEDEEDLDEISKQRKIDDIDEILQSHTRQLSFLRHQCLAISLVDCDLTDKDWKLKYQSSMKKASRQTLKARIRKEITMVSKMDQREAESVQNVWSLPVADRWRLYRYWIDQFCYELQHLMEPLKTECQNAADRYKEANDLLDKYIFEHSNVIGLTTTGAARYHSILSDIQPPVIIVEEAAEVLEGHIVTSLSPGCQHLILIGDHQQLRPSPNVYELAQRYNLDLSLFERMINNGLHCDTLELQHRMRPSISKVMRHIYKNLKDHGSVHSYENIKGVTEDIFFINHNVPETENTELLSHLNVFEADYITGLCRYLLKQGYCPTQITVLSTYSAQVSRLRSLMTEETRQGVLITAVDNYQGEENDIILLSLVRSNKEKKIGFLKIDNRICVALSRARKGLYVIGNFDLLATESSTWKNIVNDLKSSRQIGPGLELYCQTHPQDKSIVVTDPRMFSLVPEGGCMKPCEYVLNCGHNCRKKCHAYDPNHEEYVCLEPCQKIICPLGHICPGKCSEECNPCEVLVTKTMPGCGHTESVECYLDPREHSCQQACDEKLECGHKCGNICGYDHICYETVHKEWPCGHEGVVLCIDKEKAPCPSECSTKLKCGHICQETCEGCSDGRLHKPCKEKCEKNLLCGHECTSLCSRCPPCTVACENSCQHRKCDKICGQKCQPCLEPCSWSCSHFRCLKKCDEPCDRPRCDKRCRKQLKCKHTCIGLCGETCPPYCRKCDEADVKPFLPDTEDISTARFVQLVDCGHIVEVKTLDTMFDKLQNQTKIQLPRCPWCITPIRQNARYGAIIKKILKNIELAKASNDEMSSSRVEELRIRIQDDLDALESRSEGTKLFRFAGRNEASLTALKNQTDLLLQLEAQERRLQNLMLTDTDFVNIIKEDIKNFKTWLVIKRDVFTVQELNDAQREMFRIDTALLVTNIQVTAEEAKDGDDGDALFPLEESLDHIRKLILDKRVFTDENIAEVMNLRKKMIQRFPQRAGEFHGLTLSAIPVWRETRMEQGQWFSCPNSDQHVFTADDLGEYSGAECPVCKSISLFDPTEEGDESDGLGEPK